MTSAGFRDLLKKVGSGSHTSKILSRTEAAAATQMMLTQVATPAQIGAFMIAHRIRRPDPIELAGMLDCYDQMGPKLGAIAPHIPITVFSSPYDGRSRTLPVSPITALILASAGAAAVLHGGDRMPTKYGLPFIEIWQSLGLDWQRLTLAQVQQVFEQTGLGFVYLPNHFPAAHALVSYREQLGKRPPMATLELMWSPYAGSAHIASSYVHPPTENRTQIAFAQRGTDNFTTVKGLEGSCDLSCARTAIIGVQRPNTEFERLLLAPRDYGFDGVDPPLEDLSAGLDQIRRVVAGKASELRRAAVWNGGFYLWRCGIAKSLTAGFAQADALLTSGQVQAQLETTAAAIATAAPNPIPV